MLASCKIIECMSVAFPIRRSSFSTVHPTQGEGWDFETWTQLPNITNHQVTFAFNLSLFWGPLGVPDNMDHKFPMESLAVLPVQLHPPDPHPDQASNPRVWLFSWKIRVCFLGSDETVWSVYLRDQKSIVASWLAGWWLSLPRFVFVFFTTSQSQPRPWQSKLSTAPPRVVSIPLDLGSQPPCSQPVKPAQSLQHCKEPPNSRKWLSFLLKMFITFISFCFFTTMKSPSTWKSQTFQRQKCKPHPAPRSSTTS